jgi:rubredoxin
MTAAASNPNRSSTKEYRCNLCGRIFDSDETLNSHKRMDHGQEGRHIPAGVG